MTHFILLQALGIDHQDDEPFTLDKGMEQLKGMSRSLRRSSGSNDRDPAGIMMQLKDFAKVSAWVRGQGTAGLSFLCTGW